jgi:hypothetical protein
MPKDLSSTIGQADDATGDHEITGCWRMGSRKKWGTGFGRGLADPATPVPVLGGYLTSGSDLSLRSRDSQPDLASY